MDTPRNRRTPAEIVDAIYDALPVKNFDPISHLAAKSDLDRTTTQRYVDLIFHIQGKQKDPWLDRKKAGKRFIYRRNTKAGAPRGPRKSKIEEEEGKEDES